MLDERTELMLSVANTLTTEDLDHIRQAAPAHEVDRPGPAAEDPVTIETAAQVDACVSVDPARGERERQRTRESKISTACIGQQRQKHEWWPLGTMLAGQISTETFTAVVVENPQVKSGRSLQLTSGAATGRVCITPTRAAIEATEAYRQAHNLGRGGGVTNGWTFWKPQV